MTIKKYTKNGQTLYKVQVSKRSKFFKDKRIYRSKENIKTKAKAERVQAELLEKCILDLEKLDGQGFTWKQVIDKWYEYRKVDTFQPIGPSALEDYKSALYRWTAELLEMPAKKITKADIKAVLKKLKDEGKSKSFQAKMKGTISRVFTWAIEERVIHGIDQPPSYGIQISRKEETIPQILNKTEIKKLLACAKELQNPWYPIWAMALLTGCRNGELFALEWRDIDFENKIIVVSRSYNKRENRTKSTKAGYYRNIPINEELMILLERLRESKIDDKYVLPRLREWKHGYQARELRAFCKSIHLTSIKFHDLRACFATQLLQNNVPPATVKKICGWRELDTMNRYIRIAGIDEKGATDVLKLLPEEKAMATVTVLKAN